MTQRDEKFEIRLISPQFTRPNGEPAPDQAPTTAEEWSMLSNLNERELRARGCRKWCDVGSERWDRDRVLMLFPGEWFESIPAGFLVTDIFGITKGFGQLTMSDDIRSGCLAFGVLTAPMSELAVVDADIADAEERLKVLKQRREEIVQGTKK